MRQIELLAFVVDVLERLQISYALVGSYASTAWGEPRMTRDVDILVQLPSRHVAQLCSAFPPDDFYLSHRAVEEAVKFRSQFNLIHPNSGNKIDFMIAGDGDWATSQLARRRRVAFSPAVSAFVASPEDVILGKLLYYREGESPKHIRDIRGIIKVSGATLDRSYLEREACKLGVEKILKNLESGETT